MANITFVDANDNVIGYGARTEAIEKGIAHRIARVFLFNSKGELLIQKRSAKHASLPNRWDQSAAGHVDEGETYEQAAYRELKEEVGVIGVPLSKVAKYYTEETDEAKTKKRFQELWLGHYDGEVQIDNHEVTNSRWIQPADLRKWMQEKPDDFTQGFIKCFERYMNMDTKKTESAGGVILNAKDEVTLVLNGKGAFWGFPKGHLDEGENALTAARREIEEETGLTDLTLIKQLPTYTRFKGTPTGEDDTSELKTMHIFLFSTKQTELRSQDPANPEARWFPIDQVHDALIHPKDKEYFDSIRSEIGNDTSLTPNLIPVASAADWESYHTIRRQELFEARGRTDYDPNHPGEIAPNHFPFLLKLDGRAIGVARLDLLGNQQAAVRLIAITKPEQRKGYGKQLMRQIESIARDKGIKTIVLNSASTAVEFYSRLGFVPGAWDDPGEHLDTNFEQMKKNLI